MIIKHVTRLSNAVTFAMNQANPYIQYMCGFAKFTDQTSFNTSLFVEFRKRISKDDINGMTKALLKRVQDKKEVAHKHEEDNSIILCFKPPTTPSENPNTKAFTDRRVMSTKISMSIVGATTSRPPQLGRLKRVL